MSLGGFEPWREIKTQQKMQNDKKPSESSTSADDNVNNNAHYNDAGEITRDDERDRKSSIDDWNAEDSRTGRNK